MIDGVTLNQLRTFVSVCDEASFSKASRRLRRAQSAISHAIAALETTLGVPLFLRTGRKPDLTAAGRLLLADARAIIARTEELKTRAKAIGGSGIADLSLAVDDYFPRSTLITALTALRERAPTLRFKLHSATMQKGEALVLEGRCDLAVVVGDTPELNGARLERRYLRETALVTVCAPSFPLAQLGDHIAAEEFERHTQLVVSDLGSGADTFARGIAGERNWLLADLGAKHDFLLGGLGWGLMPIDLVAEDLVSGRLVKLTRRASRDVSLPFVVSTLRGSALSPTAAWFVGLLTDDASYWPLPVDVAGGVPAKSAP